MELEKKGQYQECSNERTGCILKSVFYYLVFFLNNIQNKDDLKDHILNCIKNTKNFISYQ